LKRLKQLTVPAFALVVTVGCADSPEARKANTDAQKEIREAATATGKALRVQKEEYRKRIETDLGRLNERLKIYKDKASQAGDEAKASMQTQIDKLQGQRDKVREKLGDLGGDSQDAWGEVKRELDKAVGDLKDSFEKAKDSFE